MGFTFWCGWTAVFLGVVLWAEAKERRQIVWVAKPLASVGFLAAAVGAGAMESSWSQLIMVGLALSFLGDVLLIHRSERWFLGGLVSFLLGHLAYGLAFGVRGLDPLVATGALVPILLGTGFVLQKLMPHVPGKMKGPVWAYGLVISGMVALAVGTVALTGGWPLLLAAVAFYFSDLAVAWDSFVKGDVAHRIWGLPLYYVAQLLFAFSVQL